MIEHYYLLGEVANPRRCGPCLEIKVQVVDRVVLGHQPDEVGAFLMAIGRANSCGPLQQQSAGSAA